jgi:hypothetical protein
VSLEEFLCVFAGVFGEIGVSLWCFYGQSVVNCVANVESEMRLKRLRIFCTDFRFIWGGEMGSEAAIEAAAFGFSSERDKAFEPRRSFVEGESGDATCPDAKRAYEGIRERAVAGFECNHGREDFLLVLNHQGVGLKHSFDGLSDLLRRQAVDPIENPDSFEHGYQTDEAGVVLCETVLDDLSRFG